MKRICGSKVSLIMLLFLAPSNGMFIASTAFLPSSFTMYAGMIAIGAWLDRKEVVRFEKQVFDRKFDISLLKLASKLFRIFAVSPKLHKQIDYQRHCRGLVFYLLLHFIIGSYFLCCYWIYHWLAIFCCFRVS